MADTTTMTTGDDPADFTADQVKDHLATADPGEFDRVLADERAGKGRVSVLNFTQDAATGDALPDPDADGYTRVVISSPQTDLAAADGAEDTA